MPEPLEVTQIGKKAREILANRTTGRVSGITRHGAFLDFEGWVVFLSTEVFHGPLTLNLNRGWRLLQSIEAGLACSVAGSAIRFSNSELVVNTISAEVWDAPPPRAHILDATSRQARLEQVAAGIFNQDPGGGFHQLLHPLLKHSTTRQDTPPLSAVSDAFGRAQRALPTGNLEEIASSLEPFLGWGSGLTPSGDDLVAGLLLTLRRWGRLLYPGLDSGVLASALLPTAYQKTTTLSANLIECAGAGQSDERLLTALDGIMTGFPSPDTCLKALSSWGNSSGGDALAGMSLALQAG